MEKVQVDARKLQLLNDRINQTIDALNQLRMTAQQAGIGLSHSSAIGYSPFAQAQGIAAQVPQYSPYLSHSSYADPYAAARQLELATLMGRGGIAHSPFISRSPASEVVFGAFDPIQRQLEVARANEANRAWELAQGLAHSTATASPWGAWGVSPFMPTTQGVYPTVIL